jgi:hypothetical protein
MIFVLHNFFHFVTVLSGARPALPMEVAPEAMMGCLQPIIGSKVIAFSCYALFIPFADNITTSLIYFFFTVTAC